MKDKIVDEIRAIRKKMDKVIENKPEKFKKQIDDIRKKYQNRIVTLGPKFQKKNAA
jgi:ElaB/YqjD/DUF883 family membrane-anchored ribosome-binding protein